MDLQNAQNHGPYSFHLGPTAMILGTLEDQVEALTPLSWNSALLAGSLCSSEIISTVQATPLSEQGATTILDVLSQRKYSGKIRCVSVTRPLFRSKGKDPSNEEAWLALSTLQALSLCPWAARFPPLPRTHSFLGSPYDIVKRGMTCTFTPRGQKISPSALRSHGTPKRRETPICLVFLRVPGPFKKGFYRVPNWSEGHNEDVVTTKELQM